MVPNLKAENFGNITIQDLTEERQSKILHSTKKNGRAEDKLCDPMETICGSPGDSTKPLTPLVSRSRSHLRSNEMEVGCTQPPASYLVHKTKEVPILPSEDAPTLECLNCISGSEEAPTLPYPGTGLSLSCTKDVPTLAGPDVSEDGRTLSDHDEGLTHLCTEDSLLHGKPFNIPMVSVAGPTPGAITCPEDVHSLKGITVSGSHRGVTSLLAPRIFFFKLSELVRLCE